MRQSKPSCSHYHTAEFATGSKGPRSDVTLDNKSECPSETVGESSIMHYAEDEGMIVIEDEESHTKEVPIQDFEMTDDLSDEDSEKMSHISIPSTSEDTTVDLSDLFNEKMSHTESSSDTRPTSKEDMQETNEEIVKRIEQFLVSEELVPADTVNCQAVAQQLPDVKINSTTAKEYIFLDKICEIYHCNKFITFIRFSQKMAKDTPKEECSLSEKGCKQGKELVDDSNLASEAKKPNNLNQKVPLKAGMSGEQENRKEGALDKTSTQLVHKKSTTVDNLNAMKINQFKVKKIQAGMNPTQGPMCSSHKSLSVDHKAAANSVLGKSDEATPVQPKSVTNTKTLVSKDQNQTIKKQINTAMRTSQGPLCSRHESSLVDTKASANSVLGKSGEGTPVLPKPVINTKTLVSKEQIQPVKKQVNTAMRTSQGRLCSRHESSLVDIKASANSVLGKSGEGTAVLANTEALVTQMEKKNINTTTQGEPIHQAPVHITNEYTEVIDLTIEDDLPFVEPVSGTSPVAKNTPTASKAADTILAPNILVEKYERQILASETNPKPALTNAVKNTIIAAGSSTSTSTYVTPHSKTVKKQSELGVATMHALPATIPTQNSPCSCCKSVLVDTKASANSVLGKSCESTPVLPKPVTNTKTLVSKEQTQTIKKQINTAMRTSQGALCSRHESSLVDTKASANSVLGKSGEGTPVLASNEALVTQMEKKNINTTTQAGPIHQAPIHFTNECTEVIDLTIEDDLPFVEPVSGTSPVAKNKATASKAVDTTLAPNTLAGKYEKQIQASEISPKPALTNPVKNMISPAESPAGTSTYMAPNSKIVKKTSNVGVVTPCVLPGKRKRTNTVTVPQSVGPAPSLTPVTHSNVFNRVEGQK